MRDLRTLLLALCTALLCAVFVPGARTSVYPTDHSVALIAAPYTQVPVTSNDADSNAANAQADQPSQASIDPATSEDSQQPANTDPSQATQSQSAPSTDQSQATQPQSMPSTSPDDSSKQLPKTASSTPLIGLMGMLSLAAALGLREFAKKVS
jgi:cytoskeletal protein RodZ